MWTSNFCRLCVAFASSPKTLVIHATVIYIQIQVPDNQLKTVQCVNLGNKIASLLFLLLAAGAVHSLCLNLPPLSLHNMHRPHVASQFTELYTQ